ncbi:MAG: diacylglycerol/lipid kinase family protein [Bacteroidota bacterium]
MAIKFAFVINPNAGVKKKFNVEGFIASNFPKNLLYDIIIWEEADDISPIVEKIKNNQYSYVIACGGDGTVNMVAAMVVNTKMALGILPLGSGNGLARSNNIPMNLLKALNVIANAKTEIIDSGTLNGHPFFCTAGIGFDALIAHKFAESTERGFFTYFKTSVMEFINYKPESYSITVDGKKIKTTAFLITIANAGQWGNDVHIAPAAKLNDGLFHLSILKPFPFYTFISFAIKLFSKRINTFTHFESHIGKKIEIEFNKYLPAHYDGEPLLIKDKATIEMFPLSLNMIC